MEMFGTVQKYTVHVFIKTLGNKNDIIPEQGKFSVALSGKGSIIYIHRISHARTDQQTVKSFK